MRAPLHPDVVVMDISMPGLNGIAATCRLSQGDARPRVLILTAATDWLVLRRAEAAGATAVLNKCRGPSAVLAASRATAHRGDAP